MPRDRLFDLARPHLVAAGFDQIFLPIDDEEVAVLVQVSQVARVQEAAVSPIDHVIAQGDR
jgi:hypothetical protein